MKLGLGLYGSMLTDDNFRFAKQAGATHIVAHVVGNFKKAGTDTLVTDGSKALGFGTSNPPDDIFSYKWFRDLRGRINAAGLELEAIENFEPVHLHDEPEMADYLSLILDATGSKGTTLQATLEARVRDLNLDPDREFEFLGPGDLNRLRVDAGRVGVLFSDDAAGQGFANHAQALLDSPAVVIPVVSALADFASKVPANLAATNGMKLDPADSGFEKVAALVLELLGLLRKRRRLFISYRRTESSGVAQQLYHSLDERSFDVFLDTLSVRAADEFQEQLWHRMADSDVVVLLYTQSIHSSGWVEKSE